MELIQTNTNAIHKTEGFGLCPIYSKAGNLTLELGGVRRAEGISISLFQSNQSQTNLFRWFLLAFSFWMKERKQTL